MQRKNNVKKRVGMILDATFPPDPRVENEALSLIEHGYEVFLFCFSYDCRAGKGHFKGIKICRYVCNRLLYKLSALAYTFPFYAIYWSRKIKHFIEKNNIEILHIHDIQIAGAVFRSLKKNSKSIPVILDLHENRPEIMRFYPHLQTFCGKFLIRINSWKKAEQYYVSKANYTLVVTPHAKRELSQRVPQKANYIVDIPNTVRKDFYQKNKDTSHDNSTFDLLYIGDTGYRRGLQTVIKALPILKKSIPNVRLIIVGKSTYDKILRQLTQYLNLQKEVLFEGWKPPETFPDYIVNSQICLSPLHRNQHHDTTYANKLFQYMSYGKTLLVSDATAQKDLVLNYEIGCVHRGEDVADFAQKVLFLHKTPEILEKYGLRAKEVICKELFWEKTVLPLLEIYVSLSKV